MIENDSTPKSNNNFEYDLKFGQEFEHKLGQILANKKVEVKTERGIKDKKNKWNESGNIFIEKSSSGHSSGIKTTKAEYWIQVLEYENEMFCGLIFETSMLQKMVKTMYQKGEWKEVSGGSERNPSKGILIPLSDLFKKQNILPDKFMTEDNK